MKIKSILLALMLIPSVNLFAQDVTRPVPAEWSKLIKGGQFIDLFQPMIKGELTTDGWGAEAVLPRYIDNGIEDKDISFWGGNIIKGDDGKYHFFICGWPENSEKGHMGWLANSIVYHAVCDNSNGPFKIIETLGKGHNTEVIPLSQGGYLVYSIMGHDEKTDGCYYYSDNINGPWKKYQLDLDLRGRVRNPGARNWFHNLSFTKREDGSVMMVNRGGCIWVSKDGRSTYNQISEGSVYPDVDGKFEDPVIWRDNVQYNMIVNDWYGRVAFYLRSKDGNRWVIDDGFAYSHGISVHKGGHKEDWYKYERIHILQDEQGRAIQANFAVIDTLKHFDLPNDNHSSKNISIPLQKGMLLEMLNTKPFDKKTTKIEVRIKAEEGFNPQTEVDVNSLHFGASSEVNYGRGATFCEARNDGKDLIVAFNCKNHYIDYEEFAPKMIGANKDGEMIFGYARLPWLDYEPALLSARQPKITGKGVSVTVDNFGLSASKESFITISGYNKEGVLEQWGSTTIPAIAKYKNSTVNIKLSEKIDSSKSTPVVVNIYVANEAPVVFHTTLEK